MNIVSRTTTTSNNHNNNNQACAACKYQRKKCASDCILAPYFPHDRQRQFQNAHKLFGVKKITKIIKHLDPLDKDQAMRTIIYQSDMRANDPVGGCYRYILELQAQIKYHQAELELVLQQLAVFRSQAHLHHHHHHHHHLNPYNNNPIAPLLPPTHHYQYLQQLPRQDQTYMIVEQEHENNNDVTLQDEVSGWPVQDSVSLSSLSIQNKNNGDDVSGGYVGDELYNDHKSSSSSLLDIHCDDERNEIGFDEPQEFVDRSDEGVLFKIENAVLKAEADCIQQNQDHDLKEKLDMVLDREIIGQQETNTFIESE
ncbi:LOB domain-containing protein 22-like [Prosopis cineraria]|uniref:LOB domain-containing protein 22-like n=1 Tax=Prosopis cineraria TaxID=364024 RepID=UPI00240FF885|nr:LOB domain-containing protein 22-like [Prosopis cineraria]